ncbi:MAG: FAH family protein [Candidatus Sumerlaeia bacterium]|nr:FAH family protein [Candidatus Sumerlaeia bacterium]
MLRIVQYLDENQKPRVARVNEADWRGTILTGVARLHDLARRAADEKVPLEDLVESASGSEKVDLGKVHRDGRWLAPINHPEPARLHVTGTGLTHLGSAKTRDSLHSGDKANTPKTDSIKLFELGVEGGKPAGGGVGVQPEWFYKGCGEWVVPPGCPLTMPDFSLDGGEEPELVGVYIVDASGTPCRIGYALGNEFSDHVTEKQNYLYLAHSKLRVCSFGPELIIGALPRSVEGMSKILRDGKVAWEAPFSTGEDHMSHSFENLEHHHFKYKQFRRPGDIHCHFFGTSTLSCGGGFQTRVGDQFEISAPPFHWPLRNTLAVAPAGPTLIRQL